MVSHQVVLDVKKRPSSLPPEVVVRVGDVGTQVIEATLLNDGAPYAPSGMTARLDILKADGKWVRCSASISGSTASCTLPSQALSSSGRCKMAHFVLFKGTDVAESTQGFALVVLPEVDADEPSGMSDYYDGLLTDLYAKWLSYNQQAQAAENARVSAENARKGNETQRQNNETQRKSQEQGRVSAENARASEFATLKQQSQAATTAAQGGANSANEAAAYARAVADGLQSSVVGDEDVAEMRGQIDAMGSMIADLRGEFYYLDGCVYAPSSKASISGTTVTLADSCGASGTTITLA